MGNKNHILIKIFRKLRPAEAIIALYFLALSIFLVFFHKGLPKWPLYIVSNFFVIGVIAIMNWLQLKIHNSQLFNFFYYWYPTLILLFGFEQAAKLNHIVFLQWFDHIVLKIELLIFGTHPTIWFSWHTSSWLTEILQVAYFTYYIQFPLLGVYLYIKKKLHTFNNFLYASAVAFFSCYIIYFFFPVEGPHHTLIHLRASHVDGYLFDSLVNLVQTSGGVHGNALPSAHVATSMIALIFAYKYARKLFYFFFPATIGLCIGAVYGWYHYASDIFTGIAVGLIAYYPFYKWLYNCWNKSIYPLTYD